MDSQADLGNHEKSTLAGVQVDQRDAKVSPLLPSQMRGSVGEDHFQRRSDLAVEKMPAARRAVRQAKNDMNVEACLAVVADSDNPNRAQDFTLFDNLDFSVGLLFEIEPADGGSFEGTDRRQGSRGDPGLVREFRQRRECLFSGIDNDDASLQACFVSN